MPSLTTTLGSAAFLALTSLGAANAAPTTTTKRAGGPTCIDISLSLSVAAQNHVAPQYLLDGLADAANSGTSALSGLEALLNGLGNDLQVAAAAPLNGTYAIAGVYCEPETRVPGRTDTTVQLLVHGIGLDRHYWTGGLAGEERYSWVAAASREGYATLAIDRLGVGESDRPDPLLVVQKPAHVEIVHQVVAALRSGGIEGVGKAFSRVAYVGHSFGSIIGNTLAARYPADADALVLTGYTSELKQALAGFVVTARGAPAALVDPARFADLADKPGYQVMSSEDGARRLFFTNTADGTNWDPAVAEEQWETRQTFTVGESISSFFVNDIAEDYSKPVLALTGHKDQFFCALGLPLLLGDGDCTGYGDKTARLFPSADFRFQEIANTGHAMNFHYTANETFAAAHDFLESAGF